MKKSFLSLFTVLCALSVFTACDDDKDGISSVYSGESLNLTLSGTTLSDKVVTTDNATITLKNIIPGEAEMALPVTYTAGGFIGSVKNENREVKVDATIRDGVADVKVDLAETSPLGRNTFYINAQSLSLDFETSKKTVTLNGQEYEAKSLPLLVGSMGGPMLSQLFKGIRFGADGTIVVEFVRDDATYLTLAGYAFYNVVGDKIFVSLNLPAILSKSYINPLESIVSMLYGVGIPLNLSVEGNKASFTITRETMLPIIQVLPFVDKLNLIPEEYKTVLTEVSTIIQESTKFDLSLNLVKN